MLVASPLFKLITILTLINFPSPWSIKWMQQQILTKHHVRSPTSSSANEYYRSHKTSDNPWKRIKNLIFMSLDSNQNFILKNQSSHKYQLIGGVEIFTFINHILHSNKSLHNATQTTFIKRNSSFRKPLASTSRHLINLIYRFSPIETFFYNGQT